MIVIAKITTDALDPAEHEKAVGDSRAGAVVSFVGIVRDHDQGRAVVSLSYEGHPTAEDVLYGVAREITADPAIIAVAVSHRVGPLNIGDVALVASVASAHRQAAFLCCAQLVDRVKEVLPIWKHQLFTDGTDEWVNCP
ncbi:molybdopterin synthase catalytic subunit [Allocatelliglobosispora scoriae]|uniref:Molybdopterin synthase catalytic subunit n=1 Tax=Allocatelliglobosispora scoriae TaxID=643052 RepID=A0A841BUY1_9ACTN|nr:molybdopterin synthase catalytic subunit [Allocatelliglobosispora scoriae]